MKIRNISGIVLSFACWGIISLAANAQPLNDNFANRQTIDQASVTGSLADATMESNEPFLDGLSTGQTAWWTWTAPSNGIVRLGISWTGFNPLMTVYTGSSLESLSLVASNNFLMCYESTNCGCHWRIRNQTTFHVQAGVAYQIAVDSAVFTDASFAGGFFPTSGYLTNGILIFDGPTPERTTNVLAGGNINLHLNFAPAPANDNFQNRITLRGSRTQIDTANSGASKQAGEPEHLGNVGGSSVWYSWTAPATGRVTLSINKIPPYPTYSSDGVIITTVTGFPSCGDEIDQNPVPQFFPVFAAYQGSSIDSLVSANCLPMELSDFPHAVEFDAEKGQTYQIAFDGNGGSTGQTPLYLAVTKRAVNDDFKRRIKLNGTYAWAIGHNAGATLEPGEPAPSGNSGGKSVWWTWKAPVGGTVSINAWASDHPFVIKVFTGSTLSSLNLVASDTKTLTFEAVSGEVYQISIADSDGRTGAVRWQLQAPEVELELIEQVGTSSKAALLRYAAVPGKIVLLQRSGSDEVWKNVRKVTTRGPRVEFLARPAPNSGNVRYRAIIIADVPSKLRRK